MFIRPSRIFYTHNSINNSSGGYFIGRTLDELVEEHLSLDDIPTMQICRQDGKWWSLNNRRLWIFKHLQRLGVCRVIHVDVVDYIPPKKMTTQNDGASVFVRGSPKGVWHRRTREEADYHLNGDEEDDSSDDQYYSDDYDSEEEFYNYHYR